ncbi:MAG: polysaccharide deacetylase family protein [Sphingomonadales bacterium]|nr:polysaccharide deacetylase family protein [Sphingomonadales bacterium]MDE2168845.1 polysaccharide deacetylase family protein [Sphingomonadales bacterium]
MIQTSPVSRMLRLALTIAAASLLLATPATASSFHRKLPPRAPRGQIALTFDDLPGIVLNDSDDAYVETLNRKLVAGLKRYRVPATGFVVAGKLEDLDAKRIVPVLRLWVRSGFALGNHTYSHESPSRIPVKAYEADVLKGEPLVREVMGLPKGAPLWFRHPYLETGTTLADKHEVDSFLAAHHYRVAPVTMVSQDWIFSEPYDDALTRHDTAAQAHIRAAYLDYTTRMVDWYRASARSVFGRDIPLVALLHGSRLNADVIGDLARLYRKSGLRTVSLSRAMRDPAYHTPDTYASAKGEDWIQRWALQKGRPLAPGYTDPPADIRATYKKLDDD